ncbi:PRAME family member 12-like [Phyllostomus discolor]|uniref:PRAME family member 12-like n=1 Tax=Phyllostomus discolor TaxID=89673 RepID=A0A6J2LM54_9CHIR|nr:PRAME family member 12-like [Phyllostomus discolor]
MSFQTPHRLLDLACQSLLRDRALSVGDLECLPADIFPPLFMQAFLGRHRASLKAMVCAWPFHYLPLGSLMRTPQGRILEAVFDGLDILLAQEVRPRRWRLRVLDLRDTGQHFWSRWSAARAEENLEDSEDLEDSETGPGAEGGAEGSSEMQQPLAALEVFIDLRFSNRIQDHFLTYVISWAKKRERSLHLCCKTLEILGVPVRNIKSLALVQLSCIREVYVNCPWNLSSLGTFASYLGQMTNVESLCLSHIHLPASKEEKRVEEFHILRFTSQFLRLQHLRDLYLESPAFLTGHLDKLLSCLQTRLEALSITDTLLTELDMVRLYQCPNLCQLINLDLNGVCLTELDPELLSALLEKITATLEDLDLVYCGIRDVYMEAIVPALSRCHQLRSLNLSGNLLSLAAMDKLLRHTTGLRSLSLEQYPAPLETYDAHGALDLERFDQICDELKGILRDLGQSRTIQLSTNPCPHCGKPVSSELKPIVFSCENPA